jgi:hypothetical protein
MAACSAALSFAMAGCQSCQGFSSAPASSETGQSECSAPTGRFRCWQVPMKIPGNSGIRPLQNSVPPNRLPGIFIGTCQQRNRPVGAEHQPFAAENLQCSIKKKPRPAGLSADDLLPFFDAALEIFGSERLMFGSD